MTRTTLQDLAKAVRMAGRHITLGFRQVGNHVTIKPDGSPVTSVDMSVHQELLEWSQRMNLGFVGEEGNGDTDKEFILYVDPLDGTSSFTAGIPTVAIAGSIMQRCADGRYSPIMSVIHEPLTGYSWVAEAGKQTLIVRGPGQDADSCKVESNPKQSLVTTIFPPGPLRTMRMLREMIHTDMGPEMKHQSCGSLALCGGLVASGMSHGLMFGGGSAAETCAMLSIVHGAGAVTSDLSGTEIESFELGVHKDKVDFLLPDGLIIASSEALWRDLRTLAEQARADQAAA